MILAAGFGTRLRPLTLTCPKPLIPVGGKTLIEYQIENLARAGIRELVINHAWLGEQIEQHLGEGNRWGVQISYSPEGAPLETAGAVAKAMPLLKEENEPFLLVNGDLFLSASYADLNLSLPAEMDARLWLVPNPTWHPQGDFHLSANDRLELKTPANATFSGISLLRPSLFSHLMSGDVAPLAPILRSVIAEGRAQGFWLPGYWNDVGTPERLAEVELLLKEREIS